MRPKKVPLNSNSGFIFFFIFQHIKNGADGIYPGGFIAMHGTDGHQQGTIDALTVSAYYPLQGVLFGEDQHYSFKSACLWHIKGKALLVFFIFNAGPNFFIAGTWVEG